MFELPIVPSCIVSLIASLVLAYVPHIYRNYVVIKPKLTREGKPYRIMYSRMQVENAMDGSPEGLLVARLTGCHQNSLEAFSYFSAAIGIGIASKVNLPYLDNWAFVFVFVRTLYTVNYCVGYSAALRPIFWFIGIGICISILLTSSRELKYV